MNFLSIPKRKTGNRVCGITSVIDLGIPLGVLQSILEDYSPYIDFAKIGIGTAYVTPRLQEKINLYKAYHVKPFFGGTFFEKCYHQNKLKEYVQTLNEFEIEWIEISTGTLDIPLEERLQLISMLKSDFHCLAEVGSKDNSFDMPVDDWKQEIKLLLEAGSTYCITEGRDSGTSGIYEKNGEIKSNLIHELIKDIDVNKIIFEAPTPRHHMFFINEFGANVNLGNIKLTDVLALEAERCGLRSETFFMEG